MRIPTSIPGGNVQLVERTINQTSAKVFFNSTVSSIARGKQRAYSIAYSAKNTELAAQEFDIVVIAAPLEISGIEIDVPGYTAPALVPYRSRYVPYFSTRQQISAAPQYDYLDATDSKSSILTSSGTEIVNIDAIKISKKCGVSKCPPEDALECDDCGYENIYRVVLHDYMSDDDLIDLISPVTGCELWFASAWDCSGISWVHRFAWPKALPEWQGQPGIPDSAEIAPNLFYTSGLEGVVSSMEMSCRMGRHVADQIGQRQEL